VNNITEWLQMITALLAAIAAVQSFLNGRRSKKIEKNVQTIEKATNSLTDRLVAKTAEASLAQGTAVGLAQGRNERTDATPR
jgi:hypothetical protein